MRRYSEESSRHRMVAKEPAQPVPSSRIIPILLGLGVAIACLILLVYQNPPFLDMPNHLARYYLMTRDLHSPLFEQYYATNYRIIPNVGVDFLMAIIGRIVDPQIGLRLLLCACVIGSTWGFAKLSRLRNPEYWHPAIILLPVTVLSYSLFLGFLNFVLASAMLPLFLVLYETRRTTPGRICAILAATLILFFCHLMAAVLFLGVVAVQLIMEEKNSKRTSGLATVLGSLFLMAVLYKLSSVSDEHSAVVFSSPASKVKYFFSSLVYGPWWKESAGVAFLALAALLIANFRNIAKSDKIVLLGLLVFFLLCPEGVRLSGNFDARVPAILFAFFLAYCRTGERPPTSTWTFGLAAAMLVYVGSFGLVVRRSDAEAHKMRDILRTVPANAALFIADFNFSRADHRGAWYPAYRMLPFYTAIDRPLFISGIFTFPSRQPVIMKDGLSKLGFATRGTPPGTSIDEQMNIAGDDLETHLKILDKMGVRDCWVFCVNYESSGFPERGLKLESKRQQDFVPGDANYRLIHVQLNGNALGSEKTP